jgi:acid phosphatase type 7
MRSDLALPAVRAWLVILTLLLVVAGLAGIDRRSLAATVAGDPVITAAGDIAPRRATGNHKLTSDRVLAINPTVALTLGDNQYQTGALADFQAFYEPTWGRFKAITKPSPGNHDYRTAGAAGYFQYFGSAAKPNGTSYYSFDLGSWHLIALDSNIARTAGSPQEQWLRADLAATAQPCILAYWHHARFTSGTDHDNNTSVGPFWTALYGATADIVLSSHEHNYERFGPQNPSAQADPQGIRQFVVGTGGSPLDKAFSAPDPNSEVRNGSTHGVLKLTLQPTGYEWQFISAGGVVVDAGGPNACH